MEDKILVSLGTDHSFECATDIIGREGEGSTTQLQMSIPEKLIGCSVYLDFEKPNGEKLRTPKLKIENGRAIYDVVQYLLTDDGEIKAQAVLITGDGKIWKSSKKKYIIQNSINAYSDIPNKEDFLSEALRAGARAEASADRIEAILARLDGTTVFGRVDENNVITLTGNLPDITYIVKYEMEDGTTIDIGELEFDENSDEDIGGGTGETYYVRNELTNCRNTNPDSYVIDGGSYYAEIIAYDDHTLTSVTVTMGGNPVAVEDGVISIEKVTGDIVINAVAEIGINYNILTNGDYTVQLNQRWSNSALGFTNCNGMIGILIPIADVSGKTVRFKGFPANATGDNSNKPIWYAIKSDNTRAGVLAGTSNGGGAVWDSDRLQNLGNGVYAVDINSDNFDGFSSASYIAINMPFGTSAITAIPSDAIMTIDKEIV